MARKSTKKDPLDLALEARPAFLAQLAALSDVDVSEFPALARRFAEQYHDAVLAEDLDSLDHAEMAYPALVYALNGGTFFGCKAGPESAGYVMERAAAAQPGQVPGWGQAGEFLLELEGVRICVKLTSNMLGNHRSVDLHAVDWDKPFISNTGYRNVVLTAANHMGRTVDQALRLIVEGVLEREGGLVAIDAEYGKERREKPPAWLADALAGIRPDGQLNMFGDTPKDPDAKAPMSNADRQRAFRKRKKEQQLKPVMLSDEERQLLAQLREHEIAPGETGVRIIRDDGSVQASEFDEVRVQIEDELRRLASIDKEPTYDGLVISLLRYRDRTLLTWAQRNEELIAATPPEQAYPDDPKLRNLLGKALNDNHALNSRYQIMLETARELYQVVDLSQHRLRVSSPAGFLRTYKRDSECYAGFKSCEDKQAAAEFTKQFAANTTPARNDWRQSALTAEAGKREAEAEVIRLRQEATGLERRIEALESRISGLEQNNALEIADRAKAFEAVEVLTERLRLAGLPTDYRKQPGE